MLPPSALTTRPSASAHTGATPTGGLQPPRSKMAAARARYRSDGTTGMSGGRLLVALYQRLVRDLVGAETALEARELESAHLQLVHAQEIVDALDAALDHDAWDQAGRFEQLYAHVRRELVAANVAKDPAIVARCRKVVEPMAQTWQDALELSAAGPAGLPGPAATAVGAGALGR